jgi:hypothetical protein
LERPEDAIAWLQRALDACRGAPPDHLERCVIQFDLATCHLNQGRDAEAEPLFRQALAGYQAYHGESGLPTLETMTRLAWSMRSRDPAASESMLRSVLRTLEGSTAGAAAAEALPPRERDRRQELVKKVQAMLARLATTGRAGKASISTRGDP